MSEEQHTEQEFIHGEYRPAHYLQFSAGKGFRRIQMVLGILCWPIVLPLVFVARLNDILFRTISEILSIVPYFPGVILRYEFYRFALRRCGENVLIEFGTVFIYPDVTIGDNVLIGRYNIIHHCDFEDYVLTGERCTFLSGSRQHGFGSKEVPMALQAGAKKRIRIDRDCWIGSHAVVADDVGEGCIVGAGAVVVKPIPAYSKLRPASMMISPR